MILITGGAFQGKKEYAKKTFHLKEEQMLDGALCGPEDIYFCTCIYHFHEWIRQRIKEGFDFSSFPEILKEQNPKLVIITNELGYGIVPVDAFDREYREVSGRVCTKLAAVSEQVYRVVCGIGTVIKDD